MQIETASFEIEVKVGPHGVVYEIRTTFIDSVGEPPRALFTTREAKEIPPFLRGIATMLASQLETENDAP